MAKPEEKLKAIELRKTGHSIKDIAFLLKISKGTASLWCSDVFLSQDQKDLLNEKMIKAGHVGRMAGARANKLKKRISLQKAKIQAEAILSTLKERDKLMLMVGLYWGEGGKKNSRFVFSNSDPEMILFMATGLQEVMKVSEKDLVVRVLINEIHKPRIKEVLNFWKRLLNLSDEQMRSPTFVKVKPRKVYENYDKYYGTLKLMVRRSSKLQYLFLALIDEVKLPR